MRCSLRRMWYERLYFCKIISGEILSLKVYEDDLTIAFMDTAMDVDGHVLVVPKTHCKIFWIVI